MARLQVESTINGDTKEFLCDADQSMLDAKDLSERLKINLNTIPIENLMSSFEDSFIQSLNFNP